jgi:para-aminobenzoate synthetase component 1
MQGGISGESGVTQMAHGRDTRDPAVAPAVSSADAVRGWPTDRPLAVCRAGASVDLDGTPRARWTLFASPAGIRPIDTPDDLASLLAPRTIGTDPAPPDAPPFRSGRLLALRYELGHALEPTATANGPGRSDRAPLGFVLDCPGVLAFDHDTGAWSRHGDPGAALPEPAALAPEEDPDRASPGFSLAPLDSETGSAAYREIVAKALALISAGDVYQVNLAHRMRAPFAGSARLLMARLLEAADPLHAFFAEVPGADGRTVSVCSASPELFLAFDPATRTVRTSPMKGTRPLSGDAEELRGAEKDRAELNMITDLMRNDLGRVCAFGSVRVERARTIEAHGRSVWQATSTVSGRLRDGVTTAGLIGATFPPGSVTGAPKVRAMQIIDELEASPRGFYCGSLGWLDDSGALSLNVAIRTATIAGDELLYHAGAGIVADSEPDAEWLETLGKAEVIARLSAAPARP